MIESTPFCFSIFQIFQNGSEVQLLQQRRRQSVNKPSFWQRASVEVRGWYETLHPFGVVAGAELFSDRSWSEGAFVDTEPQT